MSFKIHFNIILIFPIPPIPLHLTALTISGEQYKSLSYSFCTFLQSPS